MSAFVDEAVRLATDPTTQPITSVDQAYHLINNELAWLYVSAVTDKVAGEKCRGHLLAIAATAIKTAHQLGLDSRQDAIAKEIPF